jgi:hypothetical protein
MPTGMSRQGEAMMLQRSVEQLPALVRLHSVRRSQAEHWLEIIADQQ